MKTLEKYLEIKKEMSEYFSLENGFFFAFTKDDFVEGQKELQKIGWFTSADKLISIGAGGFTVRRAFDKMEAFMSECDKKIANECNAQEVYDYQYNNFESDYASDGDLQAMRIVLQHFGKDKLSKIKRGQCAYYSIDEIINNKTE